MIEGTIMLLLLVASLLILIASIGLLRLPDLPTRLHATTKSGVLALTIIMIAVALHFGDGAVSARALAIVVFLFITAPVAAHAIGRAGYFSGIKLWSQTKKDELSEYYQLRQDNNKD